VDVRVLAATAREIDDEVAAGRFREDLFYRLNVLRVRVPPLRDRREDIPLLVDHFLAHFREALGKQSLTITGGTPEQLDNLIKSQIVEWGKVIEEAKLSKR